MAKKPTHTEIMAILDSICKKCQSVHKKGDMQACQKAQKKQAALLGCLTREAEEDDNPKPPPNPRCIICRKEFDGECEPCIENLANGLLEQKEAFALIAQTLLVGSRERKRQRNELDRHVTYGETPIKG